MKRITLLGSTGSIGTQTLEIVRENKDRFTPICLTCGNRVEVLAEQIMEFAPTLAVVGDREAAEKLREILASKGSAGSENQTPAIEIAFGEEGLKKAAALETDLVVNALMGMRGLVPTLTAIEAGHDIALANKETLVAGGHLVMPAAKEKGIKIIPIDSEHSAIFQSLEGAGRACVGEEPNGQRHIRKIILTASGGPFRGWSSEELEKVTPEMALKHPNWTMGQKITIDSATMMNKGLEIIEAKWLFDVDIDKIQVVVHPQSVLHSAVEFTDGAILGQMGTPDMKVPISIALAYPDRLELSGDSLDLFGTAANLTFEEPNPGVFKCLALAVEASKKGGNFPAVMNGANEALVELFLKGEIGFTDIQDIIAKVMKDYEAVGNDDAATNLEAVLEADRWARERAAEYAANTQSANPASTKESANNTTNNTTNNTNNTDTTNMKGGKTQC